MGFAVGSLATLTRKHGVFDDYEIFGYWVEDVAGKRGWFVDMNGIEGGTFTVIDNEVYASGRNYGAGHNGETIVQMSPVVADLRPSTKQVIREAVAQWEAEESEDDVVSRTFGQVREFEESGRRLQEILAEVKEKIGEAPVWFREDGEAFMHPDLAQKLNEPGNEGAMDFLRYLKRLPLPADFKE